MGNSPPSQHRYDFYPNQICEGGEHTWMHGIFRGSKNHWSDTNCRPLNSFNARTMEDCMKQCNDDDSCQAFTWGGKCGDYYEPVNIFDKRTYGATQCLLFHGGRHGNNDHGLSNCKLQKYKRGDTFVKRSGTKYHRKSDKIIGYPNILRGTVGVATDRPIKTYKVEHPFVSAKQVADQALNLAKLNLPITTPCCCQKSETDSNR